MIKLIVDSTSEIDNAEAEQLGIELLPMKVIFDDEEFIVGVNMTTEEFFERLAKCKNLPKTTQINIEEYTNVINKVLSQGDQAFVISLSSGLSGSFNCLRLASENFDRSCVRIFDSETVTFAYKALVMEGVKLVKQGVTLDQLEEGMKELRQKLRLYAVVDNVKYLIKGGRLSVVKGAAATALNIKPIVTMQNKKLEMISKAVGLSLGMKAISKLVQNVDTSKAMYYAHSNDPCRAEKLRLFLLEHNGIDFSEICDIGPIVGTHAGPGCVGVAYFEK